MGLFVQRPEEPSEWAGLPSEPQRRRSRAEMLPDDASPDVSSAGLLGFGGTAISSIEIPVAEIPAADTSAAGVDDTAPTGD